MKQMRANNGNMLICSRQEEKRTLNEEQGGWSEINCGTVLGRKDTI